MDYIPNTMYVRRRRTNRRKLYKRRRPLRRPRRKAMGRSYRDFAVKNFVRKNFVQTVSPNAVNVQYGALAFQLDQLPNYTDFTNLFGMYRINKIKVTMILNQDNSAQSATTALYPRLFTINDYRDNVVPGSADVLRQSANCKQISMKGGKIYSFWIKPAISSYAYNSPTSGFMPKWGQWIRTADSSVPHYGFKFAIENFLQYIHNVSLETKFYISCKDIL